MAAMQGKLRKAFGSFKDRTTISLARVASSSAPDLDVAIVKATSHDELPPGEKPIRDILYFTSTSSFCISLCVAGLNRRLSKTRDWIVALKALMLAHRLLRDGVPALAQELTMSGRGFLNASDLKDELHGNGRDCSAFVRAYGLYLNERLDCSIGLLGARARPESTSSYARSRSAHVGPGYYNDYEDRSRRESEFQQTQTHKSVREMQADELLEKFYIFERLLERVLACRPTEDAKNNRLIQVALYPIVADSFQIYSDIRDSLAILLDAFFDMDQRHCVTVFDIYIRAAQQVNHLISFYSFCKTMGVGKTTEYPAVEKITEDLLETLEEFLKHQFESASSTIPMSPEPYYRPPQRPAEKIAVEASYEINGMIVLPAPAPVTPLFREASPRRVANAVDFPEREWNANPVVDAVHVPKEDRNAKPVAPEGMDFSKHHINADLLDLSEKAMSFEEQGEKLALALFSAKESTANTKCQTFSSTGDQRLMAKQSGTAAIKNSTTGPAVGWELALVDSKSDVSKANCNASMAGGFDRILLDNLYDQQVLQDRHKLFVAAGTIASSGSASTMATMIPPHVHPQSSFLALPAPPGSGQQQAGMIQDPFAASLNVPPPAYVQMADFKRKQQLLVQEQQLWLQYQQNRIHAYNAVVKFSNSNAYATSFQPAPYAFPYHGMNSLYR